MTSLIILIVLLLVVGIIGYNVVRNRKSSARQLLAKTRSFDPSSDSEPIESASTSSDLPHDSCTLATTLRIVGVVNVFAALIIGLVLADDFWLDYIHSRYSFGLSWLFVLLCACQMRGCSRQVFE